MLKVIFEDLGIGNLIEETQTCIIAKGIQLTSSKDEVITKIAKGKAKEIISSSGGENEVNTNDVSFGRKNGVL